MLYKVQLCIVLFPGDSSIVCAKLEVCKATSSSLFIAQSKLVMSMVLHSRDVTLGIMKSAVTELQAAAKLGFVATGEKSMSSERCVSTGVKNPRKKRAPGLRALRPWCFIRLAEPAWKNADSRSHPRPPDLDLGQGQLHLQNSLKGRA